MSGPPSSPPMDFPSSDADMDGTGDQTMPDAPAAQSLFLPDTPNASQAGRQQPLFLAGTPSVAGTPRQPRRGVHATPSSSNTRRGPATPGQARTPLFNASSPIAFPSSSPAKQARSRRTMALSSTAGMSSDPLDFPSSPAKTPAAKNRRGDVRSSLSLTPTLAGSYRRTQKKPTSRADGEPNLNSDGSALDMPASSAPMLSAAAEPDEEPDEIRAVWGTNINLSDTMRLFREFIRGFKPKYRAALDKERGVRSNAPTSHEQGEILLYETYLRRMRQTGVTDLNLDVVNLEAYPPTKRLYSHIVKYPAEIIPAFDQVLKDMMLEIAEDDIQNGMEDMQGEEGEAEVADIISKVYKIRPYGVPTVNMRELNPTDTDKIVAIKGLVIRATPIIPEMQTAFFRCLQCSHTVQADIDRGKIDEPARCPRDVCATPGAMSLIHNRCEFADRQVVRLQETPDAVPDGQTPHTVSLSVYDELVDVAKPGDRLIVTGIFRSVPVRVNSRARTVRSLFKTFIDVVHISLTDSNRLGHDRSTRPAGGDRVPGVGGVGGGDLEEEANAALAAEEGQRSRRVEIEAQCLELSKREDLYEMLARSLAPSVYAMDDVKKGLLLQLFGGTNKSIARGGGGGGPRYRGDINVLLVGDPGVAKSQILKYVHRLAPRGVYTSGKGSSAVGLTAYITRDPDSKQLVLESGALVLSDGGVCCIDEFDKMSDATRSVLHEVMEQQTVSVAKAGIITTLNARTSILAAANPVGSKYDTEKPITFNIDLPPTLISRFDLLYLVLDQVDESLDRQLAEHLVGLYLEDRPQTAGYDVLPIEQISAYITYARSRVHPTISEAAGQALVKAYVELRKAGEDPRSSEKRITATTRQLESMIRLSEAHARMRCSAFVEASDVTEAVRLMREALKTAAVDPLTGKIDLGLLNTGVSEGQRRLRADLRRALDSLLAASGHGGVKWGDALKRMTEQSSLKISPQDFAQAVKELEQEGTVKVVGEREKRTIVMLGVDKPPPAAEDLV